MKTKILASLIFSLAVFLLAFPINIGAQGNFSCYWVQTQFDGEFCRPYQGSDLYTGYDFGCEPNYQVDVSLCDQFKLLDDCQFPASGSPHSFSCIPTKQDPDTTDSFYLSCVAQSCVECDQADFTPCYSFDSFADCESACAFSGFLYELNADNECVPSPSGRYGSLYDCQKDRVLNGDPLGLELCENDTGVPTAVGCITYTSLASFLSDITPRLFSIAGAVFLFLIAYASFLFMTSQGDPEKLEQAKSFVLSAIAGLLLLLFAILVFRFLSLDVLGLF